MSPIKRKFGKFLFFLRTPDLFLSSAPIQTGDLPKRVSYPLTELHRNILKMAWCIPERRKWGNIGVKEHYWAKCFWQSLFLISAPGDHDLLLELRNEVKIFFLLTLSWIYGGRLKQQEGILFSGFPFVMEWNCRTNNKRGLRFICERDFKRLHSTPLLIPK